MGREFWLWSTALPLKTLHARVTLTQLCLRLSKRPPVPLLSASPSTFKKFENLSLFVLLCFFTRKKYFLVSFQFIIYLKKKLKFFENFFENHFEIKNMS